MDSKQKHGYDQHAKDLKLMEPGTEIWIQNPDTGQWEDNGKIISKVRKRTYRIELENGRITYRNRKRIRKSVKPATEKSKPATEVTMKGGSVENGDVQPRRSDRIKKMKNRL